MINVLLEGGTANLQIIHTRTQELFTFLISQTPELLCQYVVRRAFRNLMDASANLLISPFFDPNRGVFKAE